MSQPLELVVILDAAKWGTGWCRVPFCYGWAQDNLCQFHRDRLYRLTGEPFLDLVDDFPSHSEWEAAYRAHRERQQSWAAYHLLMSSLWPGPNAEQRIKNAKREKSLAARWAEANDR